MRLIDADALLEVARGHLSLFDSCPGQIGLTDKIRRDEIQNSIADILNAPTVEPASPWHRVEDRLPKSGEFGEIVLACNDVGTVKAAYLLSNGKWYAANNTDWDAWTWMPNVTHWMPLPEPPKGV